MLAAASSVLAQSAVRIGVVGPMAFTIGAHHWAGAEMARDEINRAGGVTVGGRKLNVELVRVDSNELQSVPDATNAVERAISRERVDFLIGGFRSEAALAMQEVAMDAKKIFVGAGPSLDDLGAKVEKDYARYKYWFRVGPTKNSDLVRTVLAVTAGVASDLRAQAKREVLRVAILAEKAAWTDAMLPPVRARLGDMKFEIVGTWQPSDRATDVSAELAAIERLNPDVVFTLLSGPVGIVVGRQMGERNMKATPIGINVEAQKDEFWQATAGKANFAATLDTYAEVEMTPRTIPFIRAFRERYKQSPTYAATTYDAVLILRDAIERAGSMDTDALVASLEKTAYSGTAGNIEFDKRHDPIYGPGKLTGIAVQWQNGQKVTFWPPTTKGARPFRLP
jgi:branched-chain amino acid transport system substrate-binding protein